MAQTARASSKEQAKGKESEVTRMEREMRELEWKMEDTSSCLESKVAELQAQLEQTQAMARAHQEDFQKRYSTPEPPANHQPSPPPPPQLQEFCKDNDGRSLELVGSKVVPRVHTQSKKNRQPRTMALTSRSRTQNRGTVQPRVRNYNIRD